MISTTKTCELKPGSETCIGQITYAENSTGCGGCPSVSQMGGAVCVSKAPTTKKKMDLTITAIVTAKANKRRRTLAAEAQNKEKTPSSHSDGADNLSDEKYIAESSNPDMLGAAPQSSSLRRRSAHVNNSFVR